MTDTTWELICRRDDGNHPKGAFGICQWQDIMQPPNGVENSGSYTYQRRKLADHANKIGPLESPPKENRQVTAVSKNISVMNS